MTKKVQLSSSRSVLLITQWQLDQYPQTNHCSTQKIRPNNPRQKKLHVLSWYIPVGRGLLLSCSSIIPLAFWCFQCEAKPGICHLEWVHGCNKSLQRWMRMVVCIGEIIIGYVLSMLVGPCSSIRLLLFSLNIHSTICIPCLHNSIHVAHTHLRLPWADASSSF
jgi:hypothetical protein